MELKYILCNSNNLLKYSLVGGGSLHKIVKELDNKEFEQLQELKSHQYFSLFSQLLCA